MVKERLLKAILFKFALRHLTSGSVRLYYISSVLLNNFILVAFTPCSQAPIIIHPPFTPPRLYKKQMLISSTICRCNTYIFLIILCNVSFLDIRARFCLLNRRIFLIANTFKILPCCVGNLRLSTEN